MSVLYLLFLLHKMLLKLNRLCSMRSHRADKSHTKETKNYADCFSALTDEFSSNVCCQL